MNKKIFYTLLFMVLFIVFILFEGAIIESETLSTNGQKLFWSCLNVAFLIGVPIGVVSMIELTD